MSVMLCVRACVCLCLCACVRACMWTMCIPSSTLILTVEPSRLICFNGSGVVCNFHDIQRSNVSYDDASTNHDRPWAMDPILNRKGRFKFTSKAFTIVRVPSMLRDCSFLSLSIPTTFLIVFSA